MLMRMRLSRVDVFMRFHSLVFTRFIVENERSHSAVLEQQWRLVLRNLDTCLEKMNQCRVSWSFVAWIGVI